MKKKVLAILLSAALAVTLLAGCSSSSSESADADASGDTASADASGDSAESEEASGNDYFEVTNADEVNIQDTGTYTIHLAAKDGWQFDIADNTDVTSWLTNADGDSAFVNESDVAYAVNVGELELDIIVDASKAGGFNTNGSGEIYVSPGGSNPMVVYGDNKGQYTEATELACYYTIPTVVISGSIDGESGSDGYFFSEDTVTISLELDGVDDSLIDSSESVVRLLEGDGYYLTDYTFEDDTLEGEWSGGSITYTMTVEEFTGNFSPLGGDGNGNYYANIGISGITYSGIPLQEVSFRTHVYSYGRTFTIESNGSLIDDTQPLFTNSTEGGIPILCDAYPDILTITWPVEFDASALTLDDFTLTMKGEYGDELELEAGTDYTIEADTAQTTITVNYIYWALTPVYTTLTVDVAVDNVTYNEEMYTLDAVSYDYEIASVYCYYMMTGGTEGTQAWTYYGLENLTEWSQVMNMPVYTLTYTDEDGNISYYTEDEDGNGMFTDLADEALEYDSMEDNNCRIENGTAYFERVYDQTQDVVVNGTTYTCDKNYDNADNMPLDPDECTGITAAAGYVLGDSWEMHGRWPWQTFINEGYQGGTG